MNKNKWNFKYIEFFSCIYLQMHRIAMWKRKNALKQRKNDFH